MQTENAKPEKVEVTICMGSSCFARGNKVSIGLIREFMAEQGIDGSVMEVKGALCMSECRNGPNLMINGELHSNVAPAAVQQLLGQYVGKQTQCRAESPEDNGS